MVLQRRAYQPNSIFYQNLLKSLSEILSNALIVLFDVVRLVIPSTERLCKFGEIVLKYNHFESRNDMHNHLLGTATRTKLTPDHADLWKFMAGIGDKIFQKSGCKLYLRFGRYLVY